MTRFVHSALAFVALTSLAAPAAADLGESELPEQPAAEMSDSSDADMQAASPSEPGAEPTPYTTDEPDTDAEEAAEPDEPGRGDFDAGGQVRLPNGPDEEGEYASFNWVALDVQGRYFLLDSVTLNADIPVAVIKPSTLPDGTEPAIFGGGMLRLEAMLPPSPVFQPEGTEVGLLLSGGFMREGAMLLSARDYPLFAGGLKPGFRAGLLTQVKLGSVVDFFMQPEFVYQSASEESLEAVQVPLSLVLALGELVKVTTDLGIYTGDNYALRPTGGGRISAGGALTVKIGPIIAHAGAGAASLLTGGVYPTIGDSFYVDLNVKYAQ